MTSMGVLMITLSVVGVSWLDQLNADTNRCVSAYYDRHHAVSFFGDHLHWKYDKNEESNKDYDQRYIKTDHCVRVRDRELTDSNNDLKDDKKNDINKNNNQPQKSTASIKFKGSKNKRKKEKKKKRRKKKKKNVNN